MSDRTMRVSAKVRVVGLAALLLVSSCTAARSSPEPVCPVEKFAFTRETACRNDGSVEFCVPKDPGVEARVRQLAPAVEVNGGGGRAGCELETETLHFFPTPEERCSARHGALNEDAWNELCAVAALPEIRRVVPTWFE